ncbi:MAG: hypothetical protein LBU40_00635 [Methanobrevibacter sp.]|jgi:hypothetical protein|nr:hypothetical protein [Methanobrevibacter sp.]
MKIPMNPDKKDPVWSMFSKILKLIDSRTFQEELARNDFKSIKKHQMMFKLVLLSIFFQLDVSYVHNQVKDNENLRKFLNIDNLLSLKQTREIYSRNEDFKYLNLCLKNLNKMKFKKIRNIKHIILDSTSITLDLKFNGKYLYKAKITNKRL